MNTAELFSRINKYMRLYMYINIYNLSLNYSLYFINQGKVVTFPFKLFSQQLYKCLLVQFNRPKFTINTTVNIIGSVRVNVNRTTPVVDYESNHCNSPFSERTSHINVLVFS